MIFKVLYQEQASEVPVRERTESLYVEAETERQVREKLKNEGFNIEYIQVLDEDHLEYEKQSENYKVESL
ncbi:DNA-dependent RNA polymerase auxiliary subunit epsilon [Halobacillus karajensis]|uniref:DNA-directed RNA polymerase subunit epsilon n=1 Tax=Halobacillus karajensis TaxID=195088 RepID=A0A024P429_9BACI|nr:DNA-directed RNA polymerase subunit epsilon [Halobacillus karajensis]CDQ19907.1 hypothetical protein BN982_02214 [Halobacillus karajensis]CDQ22367.1 hypothetical protein BN983_00575 [Halobacillus karajensis]CDQ28210.1 hypothetical protein BN981_02504 [Halobacillus karajensis]SEH70129.1 DNA-dependent RNA polymerase auxiliary subunit epsilon [Halobacillus karajensis]